MNATNEIELKNTINELNFFYSDDQFALAARRRPGCVPPPKQGYYVIALCLSKALGFNADQSLYQRPDFHFLVQHNDGTFSHRRGNKGLPEQKDSKGEKILSVEQATLFYIDPYKKMLNEQRDQYVPCCYDYKLVDYLYVKTVIHRRKHHVPEDCVRMLETFNNNPPYRASIKSFSIFPPLVQYFEDAREAMRRSLSSCSARFFSQPLQAEKEQKTEDRLLHNESKKPMNGTLA